MKKDIHYTDVMFEIYKRQAKAKILMDMYDQYMAHKPLVKKNCQKCGKKLTGAHVTNIESGNMICMDCYNCNKEVYFALSEILFKFNRKETTKKE